MNTQSNSEALPSTAGYPSSVVQAAHDAADGNDGDHWQILESAKPAEMDMAEFIERVLGSWDNRELSQP